MQQCSLVVPGDSLAPSRFHGDSLAPSRFHVLQKVFVQRLELAWMHAPNATALKS